MKTLILTLALAGSALAQTTPTIKGHALGQTIKDYISMKRGGPEQVQHCRSINGDPKLARKMKMDVQVCRALLAGVDQGSRVEIAGGTDFSGTATFEHGVLVKIELGIGDENFMLARSEWKVVRYEEVISDLTAKFGKPSNENILTTQNGYGAIFHKRYTEWVTPSVYVLALEVDAKIENPITNVIVETADEKRRDDEQKKARPNSID